MEKKLSNELFVVGVSLDCLCCATPLDSPVYNRLSALSGQVLSDAKKVEALEDSESALVAKLDDIYSAFDRVFNENDPLSCGEWSKNVKSLIGDCLFSLLYDR